MPYLDSLGVEADANAQMRSLKTATQMQWSLHMTGGF